MPAGVTPLYVAPPAASAINPFPPNIAAQAEQRWVDKNGNDTTGDGTFGRPFLTIAAAMTSITDADPVSKPYVIHVSPGVFTDSFTIKNGVYVRGSGRGPGNFQGSPLVAQTTIAPAAAQVLGTGWAGAGNRAGGISDCALSNILKVDYGAIGSTTNATFYLDNVFTDSDITFLGASTGLDYAYVNNIYSNSAVARTLTFTNMGGAAISGVYSDFGLLSVTITQSAAIQSFFTMFSIFVNTLTVTHTSVLASNFINVLGFAIQIVNSVITGDGAVVVADSVVRELAMTDANASLRFNNNVAGAALIGITNATNYINCTPSTPRTLTIALPEPNVGGRTRIVIKNKSGGPPLDLAFTGGTLFDGSPSYVPAGGTVTIEQPGKVGANPQNWYVLSSPQGGSVQLTNGVSAAVAADIGSNSVITATKRVHNGVSGPIIMAKAGDRVSGTRAGGGSFKLTSTDTGGATVATDQGTYDWHIIGLGSGL